MSSSPLIPKEKLSAYQRWELHSFDIPNDLSPSARMTDTIADAAAKAESIRRNAYESGRADGLREGSQKAFNDARHLKTLLDSISQQSRTINQSLADDLLHLSLEVARQMVRRSLAVHPEIIITVLKDALAQLSNASSPLTVILHPADALLVRTHLAKQIESGAWQIIEDSSIERGGGVLQTATSHVDATISTRWQHLTTTLGLDDKWLG